MHSVDLDYTGSASWFGQDHSISLPIQVTTGVLSALPMIYAGHRVGQSNQRDASHVSFATTDIVVTLFGRRKSPPQEATGPSSGNTFSTATTSTAVMIAWSLFLATLTAISEEIVFRGYIPVLVVALTHSPATACVGQALLFGAGHWHVHGGNGENKIVATLQTTNGLWYGLVAALTGSLIPGLVAHMLYDIHVFVSSWHHVNEQMDWTEKTYPSPLSAADQADLARMQHLSGEALTNETLAFCRRFFYAFDEDHLKSLSLHNCQRAISYAFLQDKVAPSEAQVAAMFGMILNERVSERPTIELRVGRLRLPEFLRLLFALRAQTYQAIASSQQTLPTL